MGLQPLSRTAREGGEPREPGEGLAGNSAREVMAAGKDTARIRLLCGAPEGSVSVLNFAFGHEADFR
jgi:hypothetical protein